MKRKFKRKFPKQPTSKFKSKLEEDFNDFQKLDEEGKLKKWGEYTS